MTTFRKARGGKSMRHGFRSGHYPRGGRRALAIALVLTPLYYLFPFDWTASLRAAAGIPFVFLYAVLLPGFVVAKMISPRPADAFVRLAASALAGLAWFMAVAFAWTLTGLSLGLFQLALPVLVVVTAALALVERPKTDGRAPASLLWSAEEENARGPSRPERIALGAFGVLLAVVFVLVLRAGTPIVFTSDALDHAGYVAEIAETQELFPTTAFYKDPGPNGADLRKGLLHVFYGYAAGFLRLDALVVLTWMNAFLAVLLLLSVYAAAVTLFGSRAVGILSSVLFLIALDEGLRGSAIRQSFYTHRFGIAFFLFVIAYGLSYLETGKRRELLPVAVYAFAAIATHVFFGVIIVIAGLTIKVWKFCFPQNNLKTHLSRTAALGLAALAGVAPYGLFRYITAFPGPNELHKGVQGVVFITEKLYIADPIQEFRWFGFVGVLSFLAVFALWKDRGKSAGLGYVFASFFTCVVVLFNPLLLPPIRSAITYLIARLNFLCPYYFAAAWFLVAFFTPRRREIRRRPLGQILLACFAFAILYYSAPVFQENTLSRRRVEEGRRQSYLRWADALSAIDEALPAGSVIASDPLTAYSVTAFTPHYALCTFDQHAPPNDVLLAERMRAARDVLSPWVPVDRTTAILAEHGATHVVVNGRFPRNVRLEYWAMDPRLFSAVNGKFAGRPDLFEEVWADDAFVVYAWNGREAAPDSSFSPPFGPGALPDGWRPIGKLAGEAVLEGVLVGESAVERGGEMDIRLAWSGRGDYDFRNYVVAIRFDRAGLELPLGGKPFPKVARKIKEKTNGVLYRFSDFHKVGSGFLSPDTWPPGETVLDETRVRVPERAAPGEYVVSVKLMTIQHQPTYRLRDLFFDDDIYAGVPVGRITVR